MSWWQSFRSRRQMMKQGGWLAAMPAAAAAPLGAERKLYESIGVKPVINARGTFTIITGSQSLPEVKQAMEEASRHYVHLDELMEGVGRRIAEITGAPWAIVTNGCSAALTHFTAAAIAGFNPERMQRLPDLTGLKNEVVIPAHSRNQYDHAIRMLGVKVVEVREGRELEAALGPRTALVYLLAGPRNTGALGTKAVAAVAQQRGIPVLVDAAAEVLTIPNVHLTQGATAVAYSGGKCIRGPQAAGLLLGEKKLLEAAWLNSAPHHAFGRSMKVGKEEIMGMLAAVEAWPKRDHGREWKMWEARLGLIAQRLSGVGGVKTELRQPSADLSNRTPLLRVEWDRSRIGLSGAQMAKLMLDTEPRVVVANPGAQSVNIVAYMMMDGEEKIVGEKLYRLLSAPPAMAGEGGETEAGVNVSGVWTVKLGFALGEAEHQVVFEQSGAVLKGTHRGEFDQGNLSGTVMGDRVHFRSVLPTIGSRLVFEFTGQAKGATIRGSVGLGEYGTVGFVAERHKYA